VVFLGLVLGFWVSVGGSVAVSMAMVGCFGFLRPLAAVYMMAAVAAIMLIQPSAIAILG